MAVQRGTEAHSDSNGIMIYVHSGLQLLIFLLLARMKSSGAELAHLATLSSGREDIRYSHTSFGMNMPWIPNNNIYEFCRRVHMGLIQVEDWLNSILKY